MCQWHALPYLRIKSITVLTYPILYFFSTRIKCKGQLDESLLGLFRMCQVFQIITGRKPNNHTRSHLCMHLTLTDQIQTSAFHTDGWGCCQVFEFLFQFQVPLNPKWWNWDLNWNQRVLMDKCTGPKWQSSQLSHVITKARVKLLSV